MNFSIHKKESYTYFRVLNQELDASLAPELKSELVVAVENGEKNILLNLSVCNSCDSSGLSVLTFANRLCNGKNGKFVLCGLSGPIHEMVVLSGFDTLLLIANTREDAEKLFL